MARYLTCVSESVMLGDQREARVADAMQAAYFRGVLAKERDEIGTELVKSRRSLETSLATNEPFEIRQRRRVVREQESQLRHVDWMISRLERRFNSVWT